MSTEKSAGLSTSTAILIGSCVIALGLYLGLNGRNQAPVPVPNVAVAPTSEVPAAPAPVAVAPKPVVPSPSVDKKRVIEEASASLDKHKKALSEKCLAPSLAKKPDPSKVKYIFNITFDANGKVIARGVTEDRETARSEVLACVSANFPELQVSPLGQSVLVDVPLELP